MAKNISSKRFVIFCIYIVVSLLFLFFKEKISSSTGVSEFTIASAILLVALIAMLAVHKSG